MPANGPRNQTVDQILSPDVLARLCRSTSEARGLPGDACTSEAFFDREIEAVFVAGWTCVASAVSLAAPKSVCPVRIGRRPVLLTRDAAGDLHAFHNSCRHRGTELVSAPACGGSAIVCPYHSWSYDLDGRLLNAPRFEESVADARPFDRSELGLKPVPVAEFGGLLFVNLSGEAPPFDAFIRPLRDLWADYGLALLRHSASLDYEVQANWKLAIENFIDSYHIPMVHPNLNRSAPMERHEPILGGDTFARPSVRAYELTTAASSLPAFPGLPAEQAGTGYFIGLFPNVLLGLSDDTFYAIIIEPLAPDRIRERVEIFFIRDEAMAPALADARQASIDRRIEVNGEDVAIIERAQRGRYSPTSDVNRFHGYHEDTVRHFQQYVATRVHAL